MKTHTYLASISILALAAATAHAQDAPAEPADPSEMVLDEVVVTSQKREEWLIDVPVSVAVADGDTLSKLNLTEATDLQYLAPGLGLGDANTLSAGVANPYVQDGYVIVNATLGLTAGDGQYGLSLFVKNLFDENYVNQIFDLPFGELGDYGQFVTRDADRTVGVQARVNF